MQTSIRSYADGDRNAPSTPWGPGQYVKAIARGVAEVGCAQHGGIRVSRALALRRLRPEILRCAIERKDYFWFEEDCAYMLVVLSLPKLFEPKLIEQAVFTAKSYYPDEYTLLTGEPVADEESYVLQKRRFEEETRGRFVGVSAQGDWAKDVPVGMVKVIARRASDGEELELFVSSEEYAGRSKFGYVCHEDCG